jgi:tripartite-type tricarboxylate transporter receptor subunit TctC
MRKLTKLTLAAAMTAGLLSGPGAVQAQQYPTKQVRIVIPFPAGGGADTLTRFILPSMRDTLGGQTIIVENKPGGGTIIGTEQVARSAPDGYTLLVTLDQTMTMNQYLYDKLPYDPQKDFTPVSLMAIAPILYVAHPSVGAKTLSEFVSYARANPGKLNFGTGSVSSQVIGRLMMDVTGINMQAVSYSGGPPALSALLNNETQFVIADIGTYAAAVSDGRLVGLAVGGEDRSPRLPAVPTLREAGFENLAGINYWGMWAPAGTPASVTNALNAAVSKAVADPEISQRIRSMGAIPQTSKPDQLGNMVAKDQARWGEVIKKAGIKVN